MAGTADQTHPSGRPLIQRNSETIRSDRTKSLLRILLVMMDVLMLVAAFVLGYAARVYVPLPAVPIDPPPLSSYFGTMLLHVGAVLTVFYFSRLYHQRRAISRIDHARDLIGAVTIGSVLAFGMQELIFRDTPLEVDYLRGTFFYNTALSAALVVMGRETHRIIQWSVKRRGIARDNLLIIGTGRIARDIAQRIQNNPQFGYNIVGVVSGQIKPKGQVLGIPVLGLYEELPAIIDAYGVEQVIIALPEARRSEIVDLITLCQRGRVDIKIYPDIFAYIAGDLNVDDLGGTPLLTVRDIALRGWKLSLKRGMDIIVSLLGLIFLSPVLLLLTLLIRLESRGPTFYSQVRMGLDGRPFHMIKFRSMRVDAESGGPGWTVENDPRVTRLGYFLRRTELDELPNLINVLLGQMSLVGPRPERPIYVQRFREQIPRYMERHREKAGMTGWAQVNGLRGNTSIAERTSYDLWYVENWSLWLDIKIILRTIWMVIVRKNKNAY